MTSPIIPVKPVLRTKLPTQKRGKARREQLLIAASKLLLDHEVEGITFKEIYEFAGIPPASAYHFFDNIDSLYKALYDRFTEELFEYMVQVPDPIENNWMVVTDNLIDKAIIFYNTNVAARRVVLNSKMPVGVISEADKRAGQKIEQLLNKYFKLPEFSNRSEIFILATKIVHLFLSISVTQHGIITKYLNEESKNGFKGYMRVYLPEKLELRTL